MWTYRGPNAWARREDAKKWCREHAGQSEVMNVIGQVADRDCILIDDIVDSGGTLVNAAKALRDQGATGVSVYVTHGVLSGSAVQKITDSVIDSLTITDSIKFTGDMNDKIRILSVSELIAFAIQRIHTERSVSSLFT